MNNYYPITEVKARQILDSRGNPTIEAEVKGQIISSEGRPFHPAQAPEDSRQ